MNKLVFKKKIRQNTCQQFYFDIYFAIFYNGLNKLEYEILYVSLNCKKI